MKEFIIVIFIIAIIGVSSYGIHTSNHNEQDNMILIKSSKMYTDYLDTPVNITVWGNTQFEVNDWESIEVILEDIDRTFNRNNTESEISRLNNYTGSSSFKVSDDMLYVLEESLYYAELTDGKFDPTIGKLVELWDIGNGYTSIPDQDDILYTKSLVNYKNVIIDQKQKTVKIIDSNINLDLGAIAKGYAGELIKKHLVSKGYKHAILDLGGNVLVVGDRYKTNYIGDQNWTVGIQDPHASNGVYIGTVFVKDKAIVTSGNYERFFIDQDTQKKYHHILDTDTGYPVRNNLASVTIITENSTAADALSTSMYALGINKGLEVIEKLNGTEVIFITEDRELIKSSGVDKIFKLNTKDE
ncbi:FAD:protein FMN transferase [Haloplasma contractile]|uniref:FAD:protein FMN transferase n=1 Tax=Haloplasma contractile SSD-17B TaxID=1033810 RepID=F7Q0L4_9MOLU|nr:FAD:protein FMN transferase [Haloplasma contractile]ERJ12641.1 Putative lipoprotein [Haloplasma contractile SSD-17B]